MPFYQLEIQQAEEQEPIVGDMLDLIFILDPDFSILDLQYP